MTEPLDVTDQLLADPAPSTELPTIHEPLRSYDTPLPTAPNLTPDQVEVLRLQREIATLKGELLPSASPLQRELAQHDVTVHFRGALSFCVESYGVMATGAVSQYGDEFVLTSKVYLANVDRVGQCFWDRLSDPDAQVRAWGRVMFQRGPWPHDEPRLEPGSVEEEIARDVAFAAAASIKDDATRKAALDRCLAQFGSRPTTQRTTATYRGDQ